MLGERLGCDPPNDAYPLTCNGQCATLDKETCYPKPCPYLYVELEPDGPPGKDERLETTLEKDFPERAREERLELGRDCARRRDREEPDEFEGSGG